MVMFTTQGLEGLKTAQKAAVGIQRASKPGTGLPSAEEVAPDLIGSYLVDRKDPYNTGIIGGMFGGLGNATNLLWLGNDLIAPMAVMGSAGAIGMAAKGANLVGAQNAGHKLKNTSAIVSDKFNTYYAEKPIESLKSGEAIARFSHKAVDPFYSVAKSVNGITGGLLSKFGNKAAGKSQLFAGKAMSLASAIEGAPAEVLKAVQHIANVPFGDHAGLKAAKDSLTELTDTHASLISKPTNKTIKQIIGNTDKAHMFAQKSTNWHELASGQHSTYANVKGASVQQGVSGGLLSVASVASVIGTTAETVSDVKVFRQILADLTGKSLDEVNSSDVLFSELPFAGQKARQALFASAAPRAVLEGINTVFNIKMIKGSHIGILTMLAPMFLSQAIGMFTSGNILDVYKEMKRNEAKGQENLPDQYAALIGMSHKKLAQRGGANSNFAQELGRMYAERHASVKDVMQAVMDGTIDKQIEKIVTHNAHDATMEMAPAVPQPITTTNDTPSSHLQGVSDVQSNTLAAPLVNKITDSTNSSFAERVATPNHQHQPVRQ